MCLLFLKGIFSIKCLYDFEHPFECPPPRFNAEYVNMNADCVWL